MKSWVHIPNSTPPSVLMPEPLVIFEWDEGTSVLFSLG